MQSKKKSIQSIVNEFLDKNENAERSATIEYFKNLGYNKNTIASAIRRWEIKDELDALRDARKPRRNKKGQYIKKVQIKRVDPARSQFQATSTQSRISNFKPKIFKNRKEAEKDFVMFVGFRGYYSKKGYPIVDASHRKVVREIKDDLGKIIRREINVIFNHPYHEGTAHPPPIDEKNIRWGILPHEVEGFHKIRKYLKTGIMFKWFRGGGKTFLATWFIEWSMDRLGYPWLYLSVTAIMNDVAYWVWMWAKKSNQVIKAEKGDKQNTYTQFELRNGAVLRIYDYMDEKSTGQHGWYLAFDDIIKKKWSEKPSEVKKAKNQWNYNLRYVRKKGLMIFGTRKFIGDPLEHLEHMIPEMYIDIKTPYVMEGKFPTWKPVIDKATGREIVAVPELYSWEDLERKKVVPEEDGEDPKLAFQAEMMQNPMPTAGKRWTSVAYIMELEHMNYYDICFIYIDRATTVKESSDYTGLLQGYRRRETGIRIVTNDWTDHILLEKLLFNLSKFIDLQHRKYEHLMFVIIVEKQGGGDDFEESVKMRSDFEWKGIKIHNWIREVAYVHTVTSTGDKKKRIRDRLGAPIDNEMIQFMAYLKKSEVVNNILDYPYNNKIDALDALSTGDWTLMLTYPVVKTDYVKDIIEIYKQYEEGTLEDPLEKKEDPMKVLERRILGLHKKRTVFEK